MDLVSQWQGDYCFPSLYLHCFFHRLSLFLFFLALLSKYWPKFWLMVLNTRPKQPSGNRCGKMHFNLYIPHSTLSTIATPPAPVCGFKTTRGCPQSSLIYMTSFFKPALSTLKNVLRLWSQHISCGKKIILTALGSFCFWDIFKVDFLCLCRLSLKMHSNWIRK